MTSSLERAQRSFREAHENSITSGQQIVAAKGLAHELMRAGQPEAGRALLAASVADEYRGPTNERDF